MLAHENLKCALCQLTWPNVRKLNAHMRRSHDYLCTHRKSCKLRFNNESQLIEHAKACHDYKPAAPGSKTEVRTRSKYPSPVTVKAAFTSAFIQDSPKKGEEAKTMPPKKNVIAKKKKKDKRKHLSKMLETVSYHGVAISY